MMFRAKAPLLFTQRFYWRTAMHLTALVDSPDHVCCRYRLTAFRPWLERAGHTMELVSIPSGWFARWRLSHAALR